MRISSNIFHTGHVQNPIINPVVESLYGYVYTLSGNHNRILETHSVNGTGLKQLSRHTARERAAQTLVNSVLRVFMCGFSNSQWWRNELCFKFQMLHSPPKYYCCRLMKIWWMNSRLDWTLVLSESDKTFSFMDVIIFDITLVTVWLLVRNTGLTLFARSYRQYLRRWCVNGTFRDSHL